MDWLGNEQHPATVEDALCRPMAPSGDWGLVTPADPKAAMDLFLNSDEGATWGTKRHAIHPRDLQGRDGPLHGAEQDHDALVTAWDRDSAALAAFRAADRKLLADIAEAVRHGRLAVFDGQEVGPILVLADRVPADRFCQAIVEIAGALSFDDEGTGIAYAEHRPHHLERCMVPGRSR